MTLRLRQICLVAPTLEPAVGTLCEALGLRVSYRDPSVAKYGLENALMPVGDTFLEVVAPTRDGTAAGRYLTRRKGAGGYMVILETDAIAPWIAHVAAVGVRIAADLDYPGEYRGLQLHPRDTGGALLEINWSHGAAQGAYHPAGPAWTGGPDRPTITAATIQAEDPAALAARWSTILRRPARDNAIALDQGTLHFTPITDGRGEGLAELEIAGRSPGTAELCGVRIRTTA